MSVLGRQYGVRVGSLREVTTTPYLAASKNAGGTRLISFDDITNGQRLAGVVADGDVTVVALERNGDTSATLTYRTADGKLDERIVSVDDLQGISPVSDRRWTFDADWQVHDDCGAWPPT